jgi:signal transduction protein with GAF and PtsI domain
MSASAAEFLPRRREWPAQNTTHVTVGSGTQGLPQRERSGVSDLHAIASRIAKAVPLAEVLSHVVDFANSVVPCDACLIYVLEGQELVLRASKEPNPEAVDRLRLKQGQGITGWVAEHKQPVVLSRYAYRDWRFRFFNELPEDRFEAFLSVPLLSRGRIVGVINLQNRAAHDYSDREVTMISAIGLLMGAAIEIARLENENADLSDRLEVRKVLERAKGILQQELKIGEEAAYLMLQRQSQQLRKPMKEIAEAIVLSHSVKQGR